MTRPFPNLPKPMVTTAKTITRVATIELDEKELIKLLQWQFEVQLAPVSAPGEGPVDCETEVNFDCGDGYLKGVTITVTSTQERTE